MHDYKEFIEWAKENEYDFLTKITEEEFDKMYRSLEDARDSYIDTIRETMMEAFQLDEDSEEYDFEEVTSEINDVLNVTAVNI